MPWLVPATGPPLSKPTPRPPSPPATPLDRTAEAEAAYKQFKDAAEAADWSAAHAALLRAIELDPERFRPTPEHYVIEAVLGAGSFGVVLKCRNPISFDWDGNEELLAVKTFHESDLARPVKDLFLEANALKQLSHPNIIGVREFGYVGGVEQAAVFGDGILRGADACKRSWTATGRWRWRTFWPSSSRSPRRCTSPTALAAASGRSSTAT
jgi:hypothetical protein